MICTGTCRNYLVPGHHPMANKYSSTALNLSLMLYRRNWLLSVCAYNTRQQENMRLTKSMRLTGSMRLIKSAKTR